MAQRAEGPTDDAGADLAETRRAGAQLGKHLGHERAVLPLVGLDRPDALLLLAVGDRAPVAAIREGRGHLAGVGELQQADQVAAGALGLHARDHTPRAPARSLEGAERG
ncbi:MAG TPA: hypothetical protein VKA01_06310 [Vicinamibacteria bacterium]|nr:hypothetical protein [Vicinamibacteria bacterium]